MEFILVYMQLSISLFKFYFIYNANLYFGHLNSVVIEYAIDKYFIDQNICYQDITLKHCYQNIDNPQLNSGKVDIYHSLI